MTARGSLVIVVVLAAILAGCSSPPSPTPPTSEPSTQATTTATPSASAQAADYPLAPPATIQDWLRTLTRIGFRPLTAAELRSVKVGADRAKVRALAEPGPGYGLGHDHFVWTKVGCIFLGYYVGPMEPSYGYVPPEFPAYLVQVLAKPARGFPGENVEIEVIDARTGEFSGGFGYGPTAVLGTTCGKQP